MRKINKRHPPKDLKKQSKQCKNTWDKLNNATKSGWAFLLYQEQDGYDAYTEEILTEKRHIDHFKKREHYPKCCFTWDNLFLSNNTEEYGAKMKDNGPNKIKNKNEYNKLINPVVDDPHDYFEYNAHGEIRAKNGNAKANFTITTFNLNDNSLAERRSNMIRTLHAYGGQIEEILKSLLEGGEKLPFPSLIEKFIEEEWYKY